MSPLTIILIVVGRLALIVGTMLAVEKILRKARVEYPNGYFEQNPKDDAGGKTARVPVVAAVVTAVLLVVLRFLSNTHLDGPVVLFGCIALLAYVGYLGYLLWRKETPLRILLLLFAVPLLVGVSSAKYPFRGAYFTRAVGGTWQSQAGLTRGYARRSLPELGTI